MSDAPVIAADDPLLTMFAMQHDLRERFAHTLLGVQEILHGITDIDKVHEAVIEIEALVDEALDPMAISVWVDDGRPMPWLDEALGDGPEQIRQTVLKLIGLEDPHA